MVLELKNASDDYLTRSAETFRRQKDEVPYIVDACLTYLEKNGLEYFCCCFGRINYCAAAIDAEGLFRVSGAVLEVNEIRKQFDKGTAINIFCSDDLRLSRPDPSKHHVLNMTLGKKVDLTKVRDHNVVAGVLKSWVFPRPTNILLADPLLISFCFSSSFVICLTHC